MMMLRRNRSRHAKHPERISRVINLKSEYLSNARVHVGKEINKALVQGKLVPKIFHKCLEELKALEDQVYVFKSDQKKGSSCVEGEQLVNMINNFLEKSPFEHGLIYDMPNKRTVTTHSSLNEAKMSDVRKTKKDIPSTSLKRKDTPYVKVGTSIAQETQAEESIKAAERQEILHSEEAEIITTSIDESMPVIKDEMKSKLKIAEIEEMPLQKHEVKRGHVFGSTEMKPGGLSVRDEAELETISFPGSESAMSTPQAKLITTAEIAETEVMPPERNEANSIHGDDSKELTPDLSVQDEAEREAKCEIITIPESASMPGQTSAPSIETEVTIPSETEGLRSIHEIEIENIASEAETEGQMKAELNKRSVEATMLVTTSIKVRWPQFMNSQLEIFHGGHSIKVHDVINDPTYCNLLSEADDYWSVRTSEKIEGSLKPESDQGNIFKGDGSSSGPLESSKRTSISLLEGFILQRAGAGLKMLPPEKEWEQTSVIVLTDNDFSSLPETPNCPKLGFLFLQRNRRLRTMPVSFFDDMPSLRVLDLSKTRIRSLPPSLFKLTKLQVLLLRNCDCLDELPPEVGNLQHIEILDLWGTELYNLPDEIGKLSRLTLLQVSLYGADDHSEYVNLPSNLVSHDIVSKLLALQALSIVVHPGDRRWNNSVEGISQDVGSLNELTYLQFYFPKVEFLGLFIQTSSSWKEDRLSKFKFVVGQKIKRIVSRVPHAVESDYDQQDRCLKFVNGDEVRKEVVGVLMRVTAFYLDHHRVVSSLSEFGISNIQGLQFCIVRECPNIQVIVDNKERSESVLPCLRHLSIHYLWKLESIWKGPVLHGSLDGLKFLLVHTCPKLEFILSQSMLQCLSNLEEIVVEDCASVREIIKMGGKRVKGDVTLPSLKKIKLHYLPELVSLNGVCPSLKEINIYSCPKLKNVDDLHLAMKEMKHRKLLGCV